MPFPPVNPYNKEEIEYQEAGFEYAPQYPGSYNYNQAGIQYNEPNFTYVRRDATISATTIGCSASLSLTFAYVYTPKRPGGVPYVTGYDYNKTGFIYRERDTSIPDNRVLIDYSQSGVAYSQPTDTGITLVVTATPATIGVTTVFSATPSVPATATPATIACPAVIIATITGNSVAIHAGINITATLPVSTIVVAPTPTTILTTTTFPGHSLYITVDATPGVIATAVTMPSETPSGNYTATPETMTSGVTFGNKEQYRLVVIPVSDIVPPIGVREDTTPPAYALMRHFQPRARGSNIFIINGTSVQSFLPHDWATVTRWIYGGHDSPRDLTAAEESVLVGAGYSFRVGPD